MKRFLSSLKDPSPAAAFLGLAGLMLWASCSPPSEPLPVLNVSSTTEIHLGDGQLNQAAAQARASFAEFLAASNNPESAGTSFMAKIRVSDGEPSVTEDIWVSSITPAGENEYTGVVGDIPARLTSLNMSDIVRFSAGQILEWQYFERNKIVGAQVTRLLRSRMTEEERKEHDATFEPFLFD